jgi:hypothetical protein
VTAITMLTVPPRFRGPPRSANGGYFAGLVASFAAGPVTVRLRRPPPLSTPMHVLRADEARIVVRDGETDVAEARPATLSLEVPQPVPYMAALAASRHFAGFAQHAFPGCFVCGPERARGDGLRIFAGPVPGTDRDGRRLVAAPWVPDGTLAARDGRVAPEFVWAALDCPGYFALADDGRTLLLAEFTAQVDRRVRVEECCVVTGWAIAHEDRRHEAGTALFDEDGGLCARAHAVWIAPRDPAQHR